MLFRDASDCITINGQQSKAFGLFRSIHQGYPLAPALYVLAAKGFGYLHANAITGGRVRGISLPESPSQLVNGHFVDDSFLTLIEDEDNVQTTLQCLNTFFLTFGLTIQWHKTQCYRQPFLPAPPWILQYDWKWLQHGKIFLFLGIPFSFQALPSDLWKAVLARIEKKIAY